MLGRAVCLFVCLLQEPHKHTNTLCGWTS